MVQHGIRSRELKARNCQAQIRAFNAKRMAKREAKLEKRQAPTATEVTAAAHVTGECPVAIALRRRSGLTARVRNPG